VVTFRSPTRSLVIADPTFQPAGRTAAWLGAPVKALPLPSLTCATASLTAADLVGARREEMQEARGMAIEHLTKRRISVAPTNANMFMVGWKTKPAGVMQAAFRTHGVDPASRPPSATRDDTYGPPRDVDLG